MEFIKVHIRPILPPKDDLYEVMDESLPPLSEGDDVLVSKTIRAAKQYKVKTVLLGGGVAANARLRQRLVEAIKRDCPSSVIRLPSLPYTTDNAAMIAAAGYFMAEAKQYTPWKKLDVDPNWELSTKFKPILH